MNNMITVTIKNYGIFRIKKGTSLIELLRRKHIPVTATCNGQGRCGLCLVRITKNSRTCDPIEKLFITKRLEKQGYHLACRFRPTANTIVVIPYKPKKALPEPKTGALALDLGTTVIKGALVDIKSRKVLRIVRTLNLQNCLGGDVITRIGKAINGEYTSLHKMLMKSIDSCKKQLGAMSPVFTVVVGNSVMLSFYLARSVDGLARYPFQSSLDQGILKNKPPSYIFPVIGSFIGGDIISGLLASGFYKTKKNVLYVDLGTNGEVVLITPKKIIASSTAAGPAFEGVGIQCGSLAVPGAIKKVAVNRGEFTYSVIDSQKPIGLCASGLIDVLYLGLKHGYISDSGKLNKPILIGDFPIDQNDIRKLQLAVGAIRTGMKILMKHRRLSSTLIDEIVITGEFGERLNPYALRRIGLIPGRNVTITSKKDLALKGAIMMLKDDRMREQVETIKHKSTHVELATHPEFQKEFVRAMRFSPWE